MSQCTNPSQPCRLHDDQHMRIGRHAIHAGWGVAVLVIIGILTLIPGWS